MSETPNLLGVLEEQLRWQRAAVMPGVRETVEATLKTTDQRRAYELCDGTRTGGEIAKAVGVTAAAISLWSKRWRNLGIAYENAEKKISHLVSLQTLELALEVAEAE